MEMTEDTVEAAKVALGVAATVMDALKIKFKCYY